MTQAGDALASTIDIPQQGAVGLPATTTTFRNDSLVVVYDLFGGRLDLAVAADSLRGTFTQGPGHAAHRASARRAALAAAADARGAVPLRDRATCASRRRRA